MTVKEFRIALITDDFEAAVAFYRDGLGLDPTDIWTSGNGGRGEMFLAERATLEILDPAYAESVDQIEVGERVSGQIRFAFEVADVHTAMKRALEYGATLVHEPVQTPWSDTNVRLRSPEGLQITLYQAQS
jgi:catechol 2,3-dioxygenase-like lactoylglutathione lyase family enzyme